VLKKPLRLAGEWRQIALALFGLLGRVPCPAVSPVPASMPHFSDSGRKYPRHGACDRLDNGAHIVAPAPSHRDARWLLLSRIPLIENRLTIYGFTTCFTLPELGL